MTIEKYKKMDLIIFVILAIVLDVVGYFAAHEDLLFFYITLSTPIILIAYIRWGYSALYINLAIALLHIVLYVHSDFIELLGYTISILSLSTAMIWFKIVKRNEIQNEVLWVTGYFLTGYLAMFLIQLLMQFILNQGIQLDILLIRHGINILLGWVILMVARNQSEFMVDMNVYLKKVIEERSIEV